MTIRTYLSIPHGREGASRKGLIRASCPRPCGPTPGASSKIAPGDFVVSLADCIVARIANAS